VVEFRIADEVTPNFHQGVIAYRDYTVAVACTRDSPGTRKLPVLAIAEPRDIEYGDHVRIRQAGPLTFVDAPDLIAALAETPGFQVLTPADLNAPLHAPNWPNLYPSDIKYWKPENLGEAIFNYWD
jgi:hypothetical protein